jgi:3-isopropylmalate/(R)-2-methylmalate dehydratase small subunit
MKIQSKVVVIPQENIDTDQIIPARFLKITDKVGVGQNLFIDRPELRALIGGGSQVLVAGNNFGCGSSREHAPWALVDFGFKAIVSTSFADIFKQNCLKNGLLPILVDAKTHALLKPGATVAIDLAAQTLSIENGPTVTFPIDSFSKTCILEGLDEIGYILKHSDVITAFEGRKATD